MLKLPVFSMVLTKVKQPPSGGCVLKLLVFPFFAILINAATFGWLCVETMRWRSVFMLSLQPPSGGCVLKQIIDYALLIIQNAATFGWLCVETSVSKCT